MLIVAHLRRLPKLCIYTVLLVTLILAGFVLGLRYWLLPNIENYRNDIIRNVSQAVGTRVEIGGIRAEWHGLRPNLELDRLQVFDSANNPALELVKVKASLSWTSLLVKSVRLRSLEIIQPNLEIKRDKSGKLFVAGIAVGEKQEGGSFSDLLLHTRSVFVRGAVLSWEDAYRGAPPLILDAVNLHLENRGSRHRFGLTATPPTQLAGSVSIRGDLRGSDLDNIQDWAGQLYAELPYADGTSWRSHIPLPKTFKGGRGGVRLWLNFQGSTITSFITDVHLSNLLVQLSDELPALNLASLQGRIRFRVIGSEGFEVVSEKLSLITRDRTNTGSTDFLFRTEPKQSDKEAHGEFRANHLELAAWTSLTDYLPLDTQLKAKLAAFSPIGQINNFKFLWTGSLNAPVKYSLDGRIDRGAVNPIDSYPGVTGLAGRIEANENSGDVTIESLQKLNLPKVFKAPISFDKLAAKIQWKQNGDLRNFSFHDLTFANPQIAGSAFGHYEMRANHPGVVDMNGKIERFEGRHLGFYLPSAIHPHAREWLEHSILDAKISQANLRLFGDMTHFPFADEKNGQFLLNIQFSDGVLHFANEWPAIKNIRGNVTLRGHGLDVKADEGNILGAKIKNVVATVNDLLIPQPLLTVTGEAYGPVAEKIQFVNQSPVKEMLGGFTESVIASGNGKLLLKLDIPIHDPHATQVNGDYEFQRTNVDFGSGSPLISEVNGHLQFTETGAKAQKISARIFGGPALVNLATRADKSVTVQGNGLMAMDAVHAYLGQSLLKHVSGPAEWQGHLDIHHGGSVLTASSTLKGVKSNLPEPLNKAAAQEMPFTLERHVGDGKGETISIAINNHVFGEFERTGAHHETAALKRGVINVGKRKMLQEENGLWISGAFDNLDVDQWRNVINEPRGESGQNSAILVGLDIKANSIKIFDRSFTNTHFFAKADKTNWQGFIESPDATGNFTWQPTGKGLIFARLKRLRIPEEKVVALSAGSQITDFDFPALDVIADQLELKNRKLGRLELKAEQQGKDWRIQQLGLNQADATFSANGLWSRSVKSQTVLKVKLDAPDAGKLLSELGFANSVRSGIATLSGDLSWPGAPYEMTPAKLSGNLKLEAKSGQFLKVEPGAGRLLGLMSLQSLPRRITLDFRDIFSEGFAFDSITGDMNVRQGLLNTKNFTINGPAAKVEMSGDVDLDQEIQRLHVRVFPTVGEGVSLATGILGGPAVAVTAFVLQKVLKDPLSRAAAYEYNITGTWDNPNVVKLERQPSNNSEQPRTSGQE